MNSIHLDVGGRIFINSKSGFSIGGGDWVPAE